MSSGPSVIDNPVKRWVFLTGSRTALVVALSLGIAALTGVLVVTDVLYVGVGSNLSTVYASGLLSGILTLVTVVLSINQLILSRVFGNPSGLNDTVEGTLEFRSQVEDIAGVRSSPNEPSKFLALVGRTLTDCAKQLGEDLNEHAVDAAEARQLVDDLTDYGEHLAGAGETDDPFEVIVIGLGTTYAEHLSETRRLQTAADELWGEETGTLDDVLALLQTVATMRQFFKTLTIQQDLARLSRRLIYTGFAALLGAYYLSQVYTSASSLPTTLPAAWLPLVTSVAAGVILSPFVVLVAYLLRVATVTLYTVSVGSFVPPIESAE